MTTYTELTDNVLLYLSGFTTAQDQATYLTTGINTTDLTLPVHDTTAISRGVVEIGDELIWVDTVDDSALTGTVPPYGRAFRGTTAATHASGVRVVSSPQIPRVNVKRAINEAIISVYPMLYGVGSTTFTFTPSINTYSLPAGTEDILDISWQTIGPTLEWEPIRRYRLDPNADTTAFPTGTSVSLYDYPYPGATIKVTYSKQPTALSADADVFTTVTGLPASSEDVIRTGATMRLLPYVDVPHLSGASAESAYAANSRPQMAGIQMGKFLMQTYQIRLAEEAKRRDLAAGCLRS